MLLKELSSAVLDIVYPRECISCAAHLSRGESHALCATCWEKLPLIRPPFCPRCGLPFVSEHASIKSPHHLCQDCRQAVHRFDGARSVCRYETPLRELILTFKLRGNRTAGRDCISLVEEHVRRLMEGVQLDLALNVPLHWRRLMSREFDQAGLLAQAAAEVLDIPFFPELLIRTTGARSQTAVEKKDRWKNVRNAFGLRDAGNLKGKSVLLVDDVFTSGATVNACTRTLKRGGAAAVHVFTLARAV